MSTFTINKAPLIVKLVRAVSWVPEGFAKNPVLLYNAENMLKGLGPHRLPSDLYSTSRLLCSEHQRSYLSLNTRCVWKGQHSSGVQDHMSPSHKSLGD